MSLLTALRGVMVPPTLDEEERAALATRSPAASARSHLSAYAASVKLGSDAERIRLVATLQAPGIKGSPAATMRALSFAGLMPDASSEALVAQVRGYKPGSASAMDGAEPKCTSGLLSMARERYGPKPTSGQADGGSDRMSASMRAMLEKSKS